MDADGDFTHTPDQWSKKAWLRPLVRAERLVLRFVKTQNAVATREGLGVYQGRIIETFVIHCSELFAEGIFIDR